MRKVYLLLNTVFIAAIVLLLDAYASSTKPAVAVLDKEKRNTKKQVRKIRRKPRRELVIPDENLIEILNNSNLFEANRGVEDAPPDKKAPPRNNTSFKLMGVCHFGELKSAIITSGSRSKSSSGKNYFTIGEEVGDGYKLYEVNEKTVVLKSGSRKITLELEKVKAQPQRPGTARNTRVVRNSRVTRTPRRTSSRVTRNRRR
jgi:hypothetical protein